jgi:hypothetical protein
MVSSQDRPPITPDLKVGELLDAYPELEEVLIGVAPAFKKLRNPLLRRTVARLTSLRQAATVGGISLGEMIGQLRVAAGQEAAWSDADESAPAGDSEQRPAWLDSCTDIETHDAREEIEAGGHPLPTVMSAVARLDEGSAFAIVTPFLPAPMVDKVRQKGFHAWTEQLGSEHFVTYFARRA